MPLFLQDTIDRIAERGITALFPIQASPLAIFPSQGLHTHAKGSLGS